MKLRALPLQAALAIALTAFGAIVSPMAQAAAPLVKTQAPGFYRMMLGAFEVTALSDGTVDLPAEAILHSDAHDIPKQLKAQHLKSAVETSINAYLVNTGERLVLIDTGTGALMGPTLGQLDANLRAAGYRPDQVDDVLVTHAHPDHVGGLMVQGRMAFPNATIHLEEAEANYWMSQNRMQNAQEMERSFFEGAIAMLTPYAKAGKLKTFSPGTTLLPGILAVASHGHTVGHSVYSIESKGERLMLIGDMVHVGPVQLHDPKVTIAFDSDEKAARATRLKFFGDAARENSLIGASHLSFPGLGRLSRQENSFRWTPVEFTTQLK